MVCESCKIKPIYFRAVARNLPVLIFSSLSCSYSVMLFLNYDKLLFLTFFIDSTKTVCVRKVLKNNLTWHPLDELIIQIKPIYSL